MATFPRTQMGRRPRRTFRGLVGCSLALRPACSRDRRAVLCVGGLDGFVASTAAPTATGWSEPVAGRELHPLKISTFSRRTASPFHLLVPFLPPSYRPFSSSSGGAISQGCRAARV